MPLTIHHLQVSQSERLVWLCEELRVPYTLKLHQRAPLFSPQSIKDLNPLGQAPIIQDGDLKLAESAACTEYIIHKYGDGRLALPPTHPDYAEYLYWFHFANGNLQPTLGRLMVLSQLPKDNPTVQQMHGRFGKILAFMDERLKSNTWLAGSEFTAADIMTVFTLTTMRTFAPIDLSEYEGILGYLKRVSEREGYQRAREKGDQGMELMIEGPPPRQLVEKLKEQGKL